MEYSVEKHLVGHLHTPQKEGVLVGSLEERQTERVESQIKLHALILTHSKWLLR